MDWPEADNFRRLDSVARRQDSGDDTRLCCLRKPQHTLFPFTGLIFAMDSRDLCPSKHRIVPATEIERLIQATPMVMNARDVSSK